jgi:hypothetical protein
MAHALPPVPWTAEHHPDKHEPMAYIAIETPDGRTLCDTANADYLLCCQEEELDEDSHRFIERGLEPAMLMMAAAPELLTAAGGAWNLCQSLLAVREGATDELIQGIAEALERAIRKAEGK